MKPRNVQQIKAQKILRHNVYSKNGHTPPRQLSGLFNATQSNNRGRYTSNSLKKETSRRSSHVKKLCSILPANYAAYYANDNQALFAEIREGFKWSKHFIHFKAV